MQETKTDELTYEEFLDCMEKNSHVVRRMPDWMKGSPVNKRMHEATTEKTDKDKSAKIAARACR